MTIKLYKFSKYRLPALAMAAVFTLASSPVVALAVAPSCHAIPAMHVALGPLLPANQTIAAELCLPANPTDEVDILIAGASYNHTYWDWPQNPVLYSYKLKTLQAGRATFTYDRLGTGASSQPPSIALSLESSAYVVHQTVQRLRRGLGHFNRATLVGHSLGSGVAMHEGAAYHDVDRIVLTGALHSPGAGLSNALTAFYPAIGDPQFMGHIFDPGYLTTRPGTRHIFYNTASVDQAVIDYDEAHKDVVSATEFGGYGALLLPPNLNIARFITADVLTIAGQQDALVCGGPMLDCADAQAVQAQEQPYYAAAASITALTVPNTGHNLALHPSADASFTIINQWMMRH